MSSPADPHSILNKAGQAPGFKKPDPKPKVHRYRKGQGPQQEEAEDDDNDDIYPISNYTINDDQFSVAESSLTSLPTREEEEQLNARLKKRRAIQRSVVVEESKAEEPKEKEHVEAKPESRMEEEDSDTAARRRRAKLKEKLLEQEKVVEDDVHIQNMEEEDEMEEEGNEVEEERGIISMLKPVFVSKQEREINSKKIEEEIALREEQNKLKERRKAETKMLLIEANRKDDEAENDENLSGGEMPNDDDDIDEVNQLEQWKIRELKRIKREREERNKRDKERAEIERRRRLTDAERLHENKVLGSDDTLKPEKMQLKFMQKYYHKGAFYQDSDDPIFKRDYNQAVGEDLWDKSSLPAILQKRRGQFGMSGASKYTHLTDQDTTNFDPQYGVNDTLLEQSRQKLGGYKGSDALDRPSSRKR